MAVTQVHQKDVVDILLVQHNEIKALFNRVGTAQGEQKRELFYDLVRLLAVHESAEEQVVHPAARKALPDGEVVVDQRLQEESDAKRALADLYDLGVDHPEFDMRLGLFAESVVDHATHEENEEFLYLRQNLDPEKLRKMAKVFEVAEKVAPTRPHPGAGESATANMLAGPPIAMFDRIRDAIRDRS
ncbi:hemerythrin domain-containing protein [Dactylosporangium roseum]|uniref:Hemerythrin domain-containing protein n=1 Tax=Dactylosporangium roseum TaxID=47989 RepID=A0ABY5Z1Y9_9ACTN|nr:hemerythrin domain-containing protein [Dactylosporangium roseum]UWZ35070.1 hemerythrin domain-containing protein [Dactylosporangium roseum]